MNIAYFSNQFASAAGHGIARYAHNLFDGLKQHDDLNMIPVATWSDRVPDDLRLLQQDSGLRLLHWGRKLTPLAWTFLNAPPIETWLEDSVDITHIVSLGFPVATRKKLVVTVHDIGPLTHPEFFNDKRWLFKQSFDHMNRYADAIICVSQATADEVAGYAGESISGRIQVIHEGVDAEFYGREPIDIDALLRKHMEPGTPYLLAAGAMSPRKNIKRVLEAFCKVKDEIPHHLVLAGGGGWDSREVFRALKRPESADRVHHLGYVTDDQLQALYKQAAFYVHASLFEGFGLTILEAMAAGCPVIASNTSSLPEVAGEEAILVDPVSADEISDAMLGLATNESVRLDLCTRGLERVKNFEWPWMSKSIAELYKAI